MAPDEMVFRSLIDACGRLGNVDLAMKACRTHPHHHKTIPPRCRTRYQPSGSPNSTPQACRGVWRGWQALGEMNAAGFMPDASVYSCLVAAFAMNDQKQGHAAYQVSHATTHHSSLSSQWSLVPSDASLRAGPFAALASQRSALTLPLIHTSAWVWSVAVCIMAGIPDPGHAGLEQDPQRRQGGQRAHAAQVPQPQARRTDDPLLLTA